MKLPPRSRSGGGTESQKSFPLVPLSHYPPRKSNLHSQSQHQRSVSELYGMYTHPWVCMSMHAHMCVQVHMNEEARCQSGGSSSAAPSSFWRQGIHCTGLSSKPICHHLHQISWAHLQKISWGLQPADTPQRRDRVRLRDPRLSSHSFLPASSMPFCTNHRWTQTPAGLSMQAGKG